jgi:hypothetical protein
LSEQKNAGQRLALAPRPERAYTALLFSYLGGRLMHETVMKGLSGDEVNYEEAPIVTLGLNGVEYRVDTGHGSAVAISQRQQGAWDWVPMAEGRWDGSRLRTQCLTHEVNEALAEALRAAMSEREAGGIE